MVNILKALGVDWPILASQALNFFLLLIILNYLVYRPLLRLIKNRNEKIRQGLEDAQAAKAALRKSEQQAAEKIRAAHEQGVALIKQAQAQAELLDRSIRNEAEEKRRRVAEELKKAAARETEEMRRLVKRHGVQLVKQFLIEAAELHPKAIDEALIKKAIAVHET